MTYPEILAIAQAQSAIDLHCQASDFSRYENVIVTSEAHPDARRYLNLPFECNLVSYGTNVVASIREDLRPIIAQYLTQKPVVHAFQTPNLHALDDALAPHQLRTCFMAEYFLPNPDLLHPLPLATSYELRVLTPPDFAPLYTPQWGQALVAERPELDRLGIGAYDDGELVALAACSADCDSMWQIGVDVHPSYRREGLASAVTSRLALEILARGKVPFYCAAWSNIPSVRNAIRCGFRPAWVELTVKPIATSQSLNAEAFYE